MTPDHAVADLASARRTTLLAEAQTFRLARQARSRRQQPSSPGNRRSPLRRARVPLAEACR
ncbi:MAG: hypothetical protein DLM57_05765 [Pseudonocardiales bacterium]|nr:MAG: hypothetical protein DLM57_05765 [Pseudonocardiales bacterium]